MITSTKGKERNKMAQTTTNINVADQMIINRICRNLANKAKVKNTAIIKALNEYRKAVNI